MAVLLVLGFVVFDQLWPSYRVSTDALAPEVPKGSYVRINRLSSAYQVGDIVVFWKEENSRVKYFGRVVAVDNANRRLIVARNGEPNKTVSFADIVGRGARVTD